MVKKTGGLFGLAKDIVIKSITGSRVKTTKSKKPRKRSSKQVVVEKATTDNQVQQRIFDTPLRQSYAINTSSYKQKLQKLADNITLGAKWQRLGERNANDVTSYSRDIIDVKNQSEEIATNFDIIKNQLTIISNFMVKTDYRFRDFEKAVQRNVISISNETAKNQLTLVNHVHQQLNTFDSSLDKINNKLTVYDKQLDEIYAEFKNKKKQEQSESFLERKKSDFFSKFNLNEKQKVNDANVNINKDNSLNSAGALLGRLATIEGAVETGAAVGAGALAARKAATLAGRGLSKAAGAVKSVGKSGAAILHSTMKKGGFAAGKAVGGMVAGKVGAKVGARLGAKFIPGIGWVLLGYDTYQAGKKLFETGSLKEAGKTFIGLGSDNTEESENVKDLVKSKEVENVDIKSIQDIIISSRKDIKLEAKREMLIKADRLILDASKIEIKGNSGLSLGPSGSSTSTTSSTTNKSGRTPAGMGVESPLNKGSISRWWESFKQGGEAGKSAIGQPFMGRGSTGNYSLPNVDINQGGSSISSKSSGDELKPVAKKFQSVLSDVGPTKNISSIDVDKQGQVDLKQYKTLLTKEIKEKGLDKLSPADAQKYGIDGSAESWANFLMGLTKRESSFKPETHGDKGYFGGHGSRGLFQLSPDDAKNYKLKVDPKTGKYVPFTYDELHDPVTNTKAAISIAKSLVSRTGSIKGMGAYWGPIKRGANIPYQNYRNIETIQDKSVLPGIQKVAEKSEQNYDLLQRSRQARIDANWMKNAPKREDFESERDFAKATHLYEQRKDSYASMPSIDAEGVAKVRAKYDPNSPDALKAPRTSEHKLSRVDPRLTKMYESATKQFEMLNPNLKVEVFGPSSAARYSGSTANHGVKRDGFSKALDFVIIDKKSGKQITNLGHSGYQGQIGGSQVASKYYTQLHGLARLAQEQYFPNSPELRQGGGFGSGSTAGDWMHGDITGGPMAGFNWKTGYTEQHKRRYGITENLALGSKENIQELGSKLFGETNEQGGFKNKVVYNVDPKTRRAFFSAEANKEDNNKPNTLSVVQNKPEVKAAAKQGIAAYSRSLSNAPVNKKTVMGESVNPKTAARGGAYEGGGIKDVKAVKTNVASNGAISGGKKIRENRTETTKTVEEKPQQSTKTAEAKNSKPSYSTNESNKKSYSSRSSGITPTPTYNNSSDSIPPGPADDGYGDYKNCLI